MEDYKLVIVRNAKSNAMDGAKVLSKLLGFAPEKCTGIINMMPVTLFEAKNFAVAKKLKNLMMPIEGCGFTLLITLDAGSISKINWPDGMKLFGTLLSKIKASVPEYANLINRCPSCGDEIRYHINLTIEHESHNLPLDFLELDDTSTPTLEPDMNSLAPEELEIEESYDDLDEIEELSQEGGVPVVNKSDSNDVSEFAEVISGDGMSLDEFEELEKGFEFEGVEAESIPGKPVELVQGGDQMDSYGEFGQDFEDDDYSLGDDFGDDDEEDLYNIELSSVAKRRERVQIIKLLTSLLDINDVEAKERIQGKGSVLISDVSLDDARFFKEAFDKKNIAIKITS